MPILGIMASAISGNLVTNSYESIATVTVGSGGQANVDFTSIPATYKHLQIRFYGYSTRSSGNTIDDYNIRLGNGSIDTGSSYSYHYLYGDGSSTSAYGIGTQTLMNVAMCVGDNMSGSQQSGGGIIDILDYANTSKYKTVRVLGGCDLNGSGRVGISSGSWQSTSAMNQFRIFCSTGNWGEYSKFALYGIK